MPFVVSPPTEDLAPGPWGIEGKHNWDATIVLGDKSGWPGQPYAKVDRITGLASLGDAEDIRDLNAGGIGEIARRSSRRGKTVTYEGKLRARSRDQLRAMETAMRAAFADQQVEKEMVIAPPDFAMPDGESYLFRARSLSLDIPDVETSPFGPALGHERPFALSLRASDPRIYSATEQQADGDPLLVELTSGGTAPVDPVVTLRIRKAAVASDSAVVVPGFFISRTAGPLETDPPFLLVADTFFYADGYITFDFATRRAFMRRVSGTATVELPVSALSTWWDDGVDGLLGAAVQEVGLVYNAGTPAGGATYLDDLTVTWREAWW